MELRDLEAAVIEGNARKAEALTREGLAAGFPPLTMINQALVPGMHEVGERFKREEYYVPEMLLAARAMRTALGILKPLLAVSESRAGERPRVVIGTVQGDLHDIGKNLVAMMLEGAGYEVFDLGANVSPERFVEAVVEREAGVLALSALLTTTMTNMPAVIEALRAANLRDRVVVVVGGAPVTDRYARQIGADGFASDAATAVDILEGLLTARVA
ncbi:MAG: cobalamin-binding protein [Chloroflexota bacterium]|nr:MAG: cobalamin-binding protein [Chloroflexota bacterium]